jgi:3D (Asp-Asp-Asp) domain-containing protein
LAGFKLGPQDIIKTQAVEKTVPDQVIEVIQVTEQQVQIEEKIPYETERISDNTLEKGLSRTLKTGQAGVAVNTVNITYHNGKEVNRKVVDSETKVPPIKAVVAMGTITSISRGGLNLNFDRACYMTASAYTYTGRNTSCGMKPAVGLVAVDPSVIPLGTKLYIEGYGYATAADTGGAIKGNRIDLFMEDKSQCLSWGKRMVKVYVLN